jgi:hypothetical protein
MVSHPRSHTIRSLKSILYVAICLVPPKIVCVDLSDLCPPWQGHDRMDSVTPSYRVFMIVMTDRGHLNLNVGSEP